jgi:chemotaxis methyl-accepting protein methylase
MRIEKETTLSCKEYEDVQKCLIEMSNQIDDLRKKLPTEILQGEIADLVFNIDVNLGKVLDVMLDKEIQKMPMKQLVRIQRIYNEKYKQNMEIQCMASSIVSNPYSVAELINENVKEWKNMEIVETDSD